MFEKDTTTQATTPKQPTGHITSYIVHELCHMDILDALGFNVSIEIIDMYWLQVMFSRKAFSQPLINKDGNSIKAPFIHMTKKSETKMY